MTKDTVNPDYPSAVYRSSGYDHAIGTRRYRASVSSHPSSDGVKSPPPADSLAHSLTHLLQRDEDGVLDTVLLKVRADRVDDLVDDGPVRLWLCRESDMDTHAWMRQHGGAGEGFRRQWRMSGRCEPRRVNTMNGCECESALRRPCLTLPRQTDRLWRRGEQRGSRTRVYLQQRSVCCAR